MTSTKLWLSAPTLVLLLSTLWISSVWASSEMWIQNYGSGEGDYAYDVIQTSDGGFALVGITRDDLGFYRDCLLVKTDANGNMEWSKTYDRDDSDYASSLVETYDGGFAIAGSSGSSLAGRPKEFWLVKTDNCGNPEWNRTYGGGSAHSLIVTSDGGFAMAGGTRLVKTDAYGNMLWNKTYTTCFAVSLVETPDGGVALAGQASNPPSYANPEYGGIHLDYSLVKTDCSGNLEWSRMYGRTDSEWIRLTNEVNDYANSLVVTSDGGFVIAGGTTPYQVGSGDLWLVKTDKYGNMDWNKTYGYGNYDSARSIILTSDGGFAMVGGNQLIKTDAQGNVLWNQTYNGSGYSLISTSDEGFAITGYSGTLYDTGKTDFLLIRTDAYGIPEFPSGTSILLVLTLFTVSVISHKRRLIRKN